MAGDSPNINAVHGEDDCRLVIAWRGGAESIVDVAEHLNNFAIFGPLRDDDSLFRAVSVGEWGWCVHWCQSARKRDPDRHAKKTPRAIDDDAIRCHLASGSCAPSERSSRPLRLNLRPLDRRRPRNATHGGDSPGGSGRRSRLNSQRMSDLPRCGSKHKKIRARGGSRRPSPGISLQSDSRPSVEYEVGPHRDRVVGRMHGIRTHRVRCSACGTFGGLNEPQ
jgi:hypothetical protein